MQEKFDKLLVVQNQQDQKIQNMQRLIKLQQDFSETQETEAHALKASLKNQACRLDEVICLMQQNGVPHLPQQQHHLDPLSESTQKLQRELDNKLIDNLSLKVD